MCLGIGLPVAPWGSSTIPTTVRIHGSCRHGLFRDLFHFCFQRALVPKVLTTIKWNFPLDLTQSRLLTQLALVRIPMCHTR